MRHIALTMTGVLCSLMLRGADGTAGTNQNSTESMKNKYVRPAAIPFPSENTWTKDREDLGRTLFFDPRLSSSGATSCATCHNPAFDWDDGLAKGVGAGAKQLGRKTPTIVNAAWGELFFWDGRAESLEDQALGPIASQAEMNMPLKEMLGLVKAIPGYQTKFQRAYPDEPIDEKTIAKAIATFERTIVSSEAPFDRWIKGDETAISESAKRGFSVFNGKADCAQCHSGWAFTDQGFHDIGAADNDIGRGKYLKLESMQHAFKTPSLRNASRRSAFLHDGSEKTLESVIDFYDQGGMCQRPSLAVEVHPLHLTVTEKQDLLNFMLTLTSDEPKSEIPTLPVKNQYR